MSRDQLPSVTADAVAAAVRPRSTAARPRARLSTSGLLDAPRRAWPTLHNRIRAERLKVDVRNGAPGRIRISTTPEAAQELRGCLADYLRSES